MVARAARRTGGAQAITLDHGDLTSQMPQHGSPPPRRSSQPRVASWVPLVAILVVQAILSLRLTWSNSAFQDEALYLWAGHLQWASWLHGVSIAPAFPSYFSGAPVIYPPIGALADDLGGLAGARLLSLCFMLGATALLWSAARRLFDPRAAFFAAAFFAGTAATQFLGAFATYDAMALVLLAAAAWCALRSGDCGRRAQLLLVTVVVALLVLASMTKYASVLWDPVVLALAALADGRRRGLRSGLQTGLAATVLVAGVLTVAVLLASPAYWDGIRFSTLQRSTGGTAPVAVLQQAGWWIGPVAVLAIAGAVISTMAPRWRQVTTRRQDTTGRQDTALVWIGWTLAAAVLLAPVEQARIHTTVSLFKHVGYGGWFAAIMAGYAVSAMWQLAGAARGRRRAVTSSAVALLVAMGLTSAISADQHYAGWPNTDTLIARLGPLVSHHPGPSLAEDPFVPSYYLADPRTTWSNTWYFRYADSATGAVVAGLPAYADAIRHHYFAVVVIGFTSTGAADRAIEQDLSQNPGYRLVGTVPWSAGSARGYFLIWRYRPAASARYFSWREWVSNPLAAPRNQRGRQ